MSRALFTQIEGKSDEIMKFITQAPEVRDSPSVSYAVRLACEEIIVNIIHYAYADAADGYIGIDISSSGEELRIEIRDGGIAFNPLEKEPPDISLTAEEREIGGLGIFLVRRMMDKVCYTRKEGENRLLMIKRIAHA